MLTAIAFLLFAAATLKAVGGNADPVQRIGIFSLQSAQLAVVGLEFALAIWLWSGLLKSLAWVGTVFVFSCFAIVSATQALSGQASCGCFGNLTVHPWIAFSVDLGVLAALGIANPGWAMFDRDVTSLRVGASRDKLLSASAMVFCAAVLIGLMCYNFGSLDAAWAELKKEPAGVEPFLSDVGDCRNGQKKAFKIRVVNYRNHVIRVVGQPGACGCAIETDLPIEIPANGSVELDISFATIGRDGRFTRDNDFFLDIGHLTKLRFRVTGRLVSRPAS
ncbi:MAG: hypothetical protein HYX68_22380 [Planctomycetes bacterium]|nr:hypothetical protein [Planctomycetota bacterium]